VRYLSLLSGLLLVLTVTLLSFILPSPGWAAIDQSRQSYIQQVLAQPGIAIKGEAIFQMNCAACHGVTADGNVGPSLRAVSTRKSRQGIIEQVISGLTPPMPQFQPSPEAMADLLSYLESL
jgi:mono/diheme cytochrome c family protein